jgi:glycosyltransferase involved in cell wall biosynthesis
VLPATSNPPLVSVIIPCYRDSATLARAIDSVLVQRYPMVEIIVVNDCSPETCQIETVLAAYPTVRYVRNPQNIGLAATRNTGLQIASGELVAFLDADDQYHCDKLAAQVAALVPNRVVTCSVRHIPVGADVPIDAAYVARPPRTARTASALLLRNTFNGAGLLAPRELMLARGGYDSTLRSCEDFDLWLRLIESGVEIYDIGLPLYFYHYNPAGLSKNFQNISHWELTVILRYAERAGQAWRASQAYSRTLSIWLLRHLWRSELAQDATLRARTKANLVLLNGFPLWRGGLWLVAILRLLRPLAWIFRRLG